MTGLLAEFTVHYMQCVCVCECSCFSRLFEVFFTFWRGALNEIFNTSVVTTVSVYNRTKPLEVGYLLFFPFRDPPSSCCTCLNCNREEDSAVLSLVDSACVPKFGVRHLEAFLRGTKGYQSSFLDLGCPRTYI